MGRKKQTRFTKKTAKAAGARGGRARWRGRSNAEKRAHALLMLASRYGQPVEQGRAEAS